jgi:hypothetical protein
MISSLTGIPSPSSFDPQGNFFVDEKVLRAVGVTNFDRYAYVPGTKQFLPDFFIEETDGTPTYCLTSPPTTSRAHAWLITARRRRGLAQSQTLRGPRPVISPNDNRRRES